MEKLKCFEKRADRRRGVFRRADMTQTSNRLLDEFAKLMTDMAGVAQGVRREVETAFRTQAERFLNEMDLVKREEFDAVRDMAARARDENESLKKRIAALESHLGRAPPDEQEPLKRGPRGRSGEGGKAAGEGAS
jgi:BMFP domain-containing protein YqiC